MLKLNVLCRDTGARLYVNEMLCTLSSGAILYFTVKKSYSVHWFHLTYLCKQTHC